MTAIANGGASFGLEQIAGIYVELEVGLADFPQAVFSPPRDHKFLGNFAAELIGHDADWYDLDFSKPTETSKIQTLPFVTEKTGGLLKSLCIIRDKKTRLSADILLNKPALNTCWYRFCYVKEICQAVIYEDYKNANSEDFYPKTATYDQAIFLFSNLIRNPFSFGDFSAPESVYPLELKIENAAEVLAACLLIDIDAIMTEKKLVLEKDGRVGLEEYDFYTLAKKWQVPERYVFLLMTANEAEVFHSLVKARRDGV